MKQLLKNKFFLAALALGIFIIGKIFFGSSSGSALDPAFGQAKKETLIQRVTIAGTITPARKTQIAAPYAGYVKKLYVKIGNKVKQNDPIISIAQSLHAQDSAYPIRAPFAGTIVQIEVNEGEYVKENGETVRIDDLNHLFIRANAPEIDRIKLKIGQEATIKASAIVNRAYKGVIRDMALAGKEKDQWGSRAQIDFPVWIEILDADEQLRPGMSAILDISANKKENVLTLAHEYIRKDGDQYFVTLKNGKKQPIKVGMQNEEAFEIVEGITEKDIVQLVDFSSLTKTEGN